MKKKTITELCSKLAKLEGKKHQCSVGDIREIFRCFADLCISDSKVWIDVFYDYTVKRAGKKRRLQKAKLQGTLVHRARAS